MAMQIQNINGLMILKYGMVFLNKDFAGLELYLSRSRNIEHHSGKWQMVACGMFLFMYGCLKPAFFNN
jgi:hypothetical protein